MPDVCEDGSLGAPELPKSRRERMPLRRRLIIIALVFLVLMAFVIIVVLLMLLIFAQRSGSNILYDDCDKVLRFAGDPNLHCYKFYVNASKISGMNIVSSLEEFCVSRKFKHNELTTEGTAHLISVNCEEEAQMMEKLVQKHFEKGEHMVVGVAPNRATGWAWFDKSNTTYLNSNRARAHDQPSSRTPDGDCVYYNDIFGKFAVDSCPTTVTSREGEVIAGKFVCEAHFIGSSNATTKR